MSAHHKMRVSGDLLWLEPLLRGVGRYIPLRKVVAIESYNSRRTAADYQVGCCLDEGRGRFKIRVLTGPSKLTRTQRPYYLKVTGHRPIDIESLLFTLAHELAHVVHWNHNKKHIQLTSRIMLHFAMRIDIILNDINAQSPYTVAIIGKKGVRK